MESALVGKLFPSTGTHGGDSEGVGDRHAHVRYSELPRTVETTKHFARQALGVEVAGAKHASTSGEREDSLGSRSA